MTYNLRDDIIKSNILTKAQIKFLEYCKELGYGKVEVTVKNGEPVLGVEKERLLKFD